MNLFPANDVVIDKKITVDRGSAIGNAIGEIKRTDITVTVVFVTDRATGHRRRHVWTGLVTAMLGGIDTG